MCVTGPSSLLYLATKPSNPNGYILLLLLKMFVHSCGHSQCEVKPWGRLCSERDQVGGTWYREWTPSCLLWGKYVFWKHFHSYFFSKLLLHSKFPIPSIVECSSLLPINENIKPYWAQKQSEANKNAQEVCLVWGCNCAMRCVLWCGLYMVCDFCWVWFLMRLWLSWKYRFPVSDSKRKDYL